MGGNKMKTVNFRPDHVAISVSNLDRSIEWYNSMFGFETEVQFDRKDLEIRGAMLRLQGYGLEIFQPYSPEDLPVYRKELASDLKVLGTKHLALSVDDLGIAYESLQAKGAEFAGEIVEGKTAKYFFAKDPDGILVEVKQALEGN